MSTPAGMSIYDAIGGEPALIAVVDDFYNRVIADPELAGFFAGTNTARLKGRQVEFLAAAFGGPHTYPGAAMREVHRGRGIRQEHFDAVAGHLLAALRAAGVPAETIDRVADLVRPLAEEIVSRAASLFPHPHSRTAFPYPPGHREPLHSPGVRAVAQFG